MKGAFSLNNLLVGTVRPPDYGGALSRAALCKRKYFFRSNDRRVESVRSRTS